MPGASLSRKIRIRELLLNRLKSGFDAIQIIKFSSRNNPKITLFY
jgi:hypothetical protein